MNGRASLQILGDVQSARRPKTLNFQLSMVCRCTTNVNGKKQLRKSFSASPASRKSWKASCKQYRRVEETVLLKQSIQTLL